MQEEQTYFILLFLSYITFSSVCAAFVSSICPQHGLPFLKRFLHLNDPLII